MSRDRVALHDTVTTNIAMFGVPSRIWNALDALSANARAARLRDALRELEDIDTDASALSMSVPAAQSLLACGWMVACTTHTKHDYRGALLEISAAQDTYDEIAFDRRKLIELLKKAVQSWQ